MKLRFSIFFVAGLIVCNSLYSQTTERFLKLNRIIALDSVKKISLPSPTTLTPPTTAFTVKVPSGVYWKFTGIHFSQSVEDSANFLSTSQPFNFYLKVNSSYVSQLHSDQAAGALTEPLSHRASVTQATFPGWGNEFIRTTPLWCAPNSILQLRVIQGGTASTGPFKFNLYLTAEEYTLE